MSEKVKASTVTLPGYTMVQLRQISSKRKGDKNLAWSHDNIVIELINKEAKKISRVVSYERT
jgi:hypothetical protein